MHRICVSVSWIFLSHGLEEIHSLYNIELHVVNLEKVKATWAKTGCHTGNLGPMCPLKKKVGKLTYNHLSPSALTIKSFPAGPVEPATLQVPIGDHVRWGCTHVGPGGLTELRSGQPPQASSDPGPAAADAWSAGVGARGWAGAPGSGHAQWRRQGSGREPGSRSSTFIGCQEELPGARTLARSQTRRLGARCSREDPAAAPNPAAFSPCEPWPASVTPPPSAGPPTPWCGLRPSPCVATRCGAPRAKRWISLAPSASTSSTWACWAASWGCRWCSCPPTRACPTACSWRTWPWCARRPPSSPAPGRPAAGRR